MLECLEMTELPLNSAWLPKACRWHPHSHQHSIDKCIRMALNLATLNVRELRDPSKCVCLLGDSQTSV